MSKPIRSFEYSTVTTLEEVVKEGFLIEKFKSRDSAAIVSLIRENMREFDQQEKVFSTIHRRLENLAHEYSKEGTSLFVIKNQITRKPIACVGIGSFQGLPWTERIGEVRDLVVQKNFRSRGLGRRLLKKTLIKAKELGYKRLYLEVSKHMKVAQKLVCQNGFHPVEHLPNQTKKIKKTPSYFLLADLRSQFLDEV